MIMGATTLRLLLLLLMLVRCFRIGAEGLYIVVIISDNADAVIITFGLVHVIYLPAK